MAYINGKEVNLALVQGLSAYEVAVKNGFEGTEQEWIDSLKGEKGENSYLGDAAEDFSIFNNEYAGNKGDVYHVDKSGQISFPFSLSFMKVGTVREGEQFVFYINGGDYTPYIGMLLYCTNEATGESCVLRVVYVDENSFCHYEIVEGNDCELYTTFRAQQCAIDILKGDKLVWLGDHWEKLVPTVQTHEFAKAANVTEQIAESLATARTEIAENEQKANNTFANILKGTANGDEVIIDDASPIEHEINVRVNSENLIPYPFEYTTKTIRGVTFTDNGDGSITVNGTATAEASFILTQWKEDSGLYLSDGVYSLSGNTSELCNLYVRTYSDSTKLLSDTGSGCANVRLKNMQGAGVRIILQVQKGATVENVTVTPMLEKSPTISPYKPYVNPSGATVYKYETTDKVKFEQSTVTASGDDAQAYTEITLDTNLTTSKTYIFVADFEQTGTPSTVGVSAVSPQTSMTLNSSSADKTGRIVQVWTQYNYPITGLRFYSNKTDTAAAGTAVIFKNVRIIQIDEATTHAPSEDGTISGIVPIYPSMTLLTDKYGTVVDCNYNKDINAAFEELQQAIISLGSNI